LSGFRYNTSLKIKKADNKSY